MEDSIQNKVLNSSLIQIGIYSEGGTEHKNRVFYVFLLIEDQEFQDRISRKV